MKIISTKIPVWLKSRVIYYAKKLGITPYLKELFVEYVPKTSQDQPNAWLSPDLEVQYKQAKLMFTKSDEVKYKSEFADGLVKHEMYEIFFEIHLRNWLKEKLDVSDYNYLNKKIDTIIETLLEIEKEKK